MQRISIASIRRAAQCVRMTGPVTEARIAQVLKVELNVVMHYVKGTTNLSSELGIEKKKLIRNAEYVAAMRRLQEHGVLVTIRRIAHLSGASTDAVRGWRDRNRFHARSICNEHEINRYAIAQRARWHARSCRNDLGRLSKIRLADKIGMERAGFFRFLKKWPSLRLELENKR